MIFKAAFLVVPLLYAYLMFSFSKRRLTSALNERSVEITDIRLNDLFDRLAAVIGVPRLNAYMYDVPMINGLATPDGRVFITRGFYNAYIHGDVTDAEIGSVIAHELGHVACGHTRRRNIDFVGQTALRKVLGIFIARFIPVIGPFISGYVANFVGGLFAARLSQKDEFEADEYGAALMVKAGYGIEPCISLYEKLDDLVGASSADTHQLSWLSSHPKTQKRIARLKQLAKDWS